MTATNELRRLLDERGVDHTNAASFTAWNANGVGYAAENNPHKENCLILRRNATPEQAIAATLGREKCKEVYLLTAMDIGDGKDEVLGVYATESAAMEAAKTDGNQFGYAFHNVCKWEVVE